MSSSYSYHSLESGYASSEKQQQHIQERGRNNDLNSLDSFIKQQGPVQPLQHGRGPSLSEVVKNLDIHVLAKPSCPACKMLKTLLDQNHLTNSVDIVDPQMMSSSAFRFYPHRDKINGVPFIWSRKTGRTIEGAPRSVQELVQGLS